MVCLSNKEFYFSSKREDLLLALIAARADEIAAVLVSPLQGLNPGAPPPSDLVLMDAVLVVRGRREQLHTRWDEEDALATLQVRAAADGADGYREWLRRLRQACSAARVPLLFDEVRK